MAIRPWGICFHAVICPWGIPPFDAIIIKGEWNDEGWSNHHQGRIVIRPYHSHFLIYNCYICNVKQVAYFELLKKLNTYKNYTAGWDGENAVPLSKKVIQNFNLVLEHIDRRLLVGLTIYPEINGSLLVDSQKREAGISLGETHFSYYEIENGVVSGEDKIPFSVDEFSRIVTQINR